VWAASESRWSGHGEYTAAVQVHEQNLNILKQRRERIKANEAFHANTLAVIKANEAFHANSLAMERAELAHVDAMIRVSSLNKVTELARTAAEKVTNTEANVGPACDAQWQALPHTLEEWHGSTGAREHQPSILKRTLEHLPERRRVTRVPHGFEIRAENGGVAVMPERVYWKARDAWTGDFEEGAKEMLNRIVTAIGALQEDAQTGNRRRNEAISTPADQQMYDQLLREQELLVLQHQELLRERERRQSQAQVPESEQGQQGQGQVPMLTPGTELASAPHAPYTKTFMSLGIELCANIVKDARAKRARRGTDGSGGCGGGGDHGGSGLRTGVVCESVGRKLPLSDRPTTAVPKGAAKAREGEGGWQEREGARGGATTAASCHDIARFLEVNGGRAVVNALIMAERKDACHKSTVARFLEAYGGRAVIDALVTTEGRHAYLSDLSLCIIFVKFDVVSSEAIPGETDEAIVDRICMVTKKMLKNMIGGGGGGGGSAAPDTPESICKAVYALARNIMTAGPRQATTSVAVAVKAAKDAMVVEATAATAADAATAKSTSERSFRTAAVGAAADALLQEADRPARTGPSQTELRGAKLQLLSLGEEHEKQKETEKENEKEAEKVDAEDIATGAGVSLESQRIPWYQLPSTDQLDMDPAYHREYRLTLDTIEGAAYADGEWEDVCFVCKDGGSLVTCEYGHEVGRRQLWFIPLLSSTNPWLRVESPVSVDTLLLKPKLDCFCVRKCNMLNHPTPVPRVKLHFPIACTIAAHVAPL
jgi:hypothetical protein